jgi:hypothetical protein
VYPVVILSIGKEKIKKLAGYVLVDVETDPVSQ